MTVKLHDDEITDCVEILNPLSIATCSKDKSIVLFDVNNEVILYKITDQHEKAIMHLRYQHKHGANLISIG